MNPRRILQAGIPRTTIVPATILFAVLLLPATPPHPALAQPPDPGAPTQDSYLDETARRLMTGARTARAATRQAITTHAALVRERLSFDAPTSRRDRPWMRGERVLDARWSRSAPPTLDLLDEHFRHPGLGPSRPRYFQGLRAGHLPVDPLADPFTLGLAPFMGGDAATTAIHSPLGPDAERYYQFRSNGNTTLQLHNGQTVETVAVTAIPRYRSIRLVAAIMWIDPETFALVRTAYRPAKRIDHEFAGVLREADGWWLGLNIDPGEDTPAEDPPTAQPGWFGQLINETFTAVLLGIETDISAVTVDLAPAQPGHWLPRQAQWTGYTGIESVTATGSVVPTLPFVIDWTLDPTDGDEEWNPARARDDALALGNTLAAIGNGDGGDTGQAASPWYLYPPIWTLNLVRYNPVEGVSIGAQMRRDFGWWRSVLTVRAATREWKEVPDLDLTFQRDRPGLRTQFSMYRSLRTGALGAGGIDGFPLPLILESDSLDFHRSTGAALRFLSGSGDRLGLSLGLFAERDEVIETGHDHDHEGGNGTEHEHAAAVRTNDGDDETGHERTRIGAALEWRPWWGGMGQESIGAGGTVSVRGSAGDNAHVRTVIEGGLLVPLAARISLGLQAGFANVSGDPAPQDLWDLGATGAFLRGHADAVETSRAWMGRADLQFPVRYARLSLFGDWARAEGEDYYAAGAGLVLLDGLLRVDFAQGLTAEREGGPERGFRIHVLMDNLF